MVKITRFDVTYINNTTGVYRAGQLIEGIVTLETSKKLTVKGIRVQFEGKAKIRWNEGSDEESTIYENKETYFCQDVVLFGKHPEQGRSTKDLQAGTHTFPFRFLLPSPLPASFEEDVGGVHYHTKAIVDRPRRHDDIVKKPFTVVGSLDLNTELEAMNEVRARRQKNICCMSCSSGPVSAAFFLPRKGYVLGEAVQLCAEIDNFSSCNIAQSCITLNQRIDFHATNKTRSDSKWLTRKSRPMIPAGSSRKWSEQLVIPSDLPLSFLTGCSIIDIHYFLTLSLSPSDPSHELEVPLEIVIGSIPHRQAQLQQQFSSEAMPHVAPLHSTSLTSRTRTTSVTGSAVALTSDDATSLFPMAVSQCVLSPPVNSKTVFGIRNPGSAGFRAIRPLASPPMFGGLSAPRSVSSSTNRTLDFFAPRQSPFTNS